MVTYREPHGLVSLFMYAFCFVTVTADEVLERNRHGQL